MEKIMVKPNVQGFVGATMTDAGMLYNGFVCQPVIDKCEGCERAHAFEGNNYCSNYSTPASKWTLGTCNMATHIKKEFKAAAKINPLKASKRATKAK